MHYRLTRGIAVGVALLACGAAASAQEPGRRRPNVIVIMADDLGYECIACNGGKSYKTPHLDKLAAQGMRFERCYAQPLCTPTRVQLMTGRYNVRNYINFGSLDTKATTFANLFKTAGYATCIIGKWQLGQGLGLPKHFGFDEYCLWQHTRRPPRFANPGIEINGKEVDYNNGEYGPDLVNAYGLDFITRKKNEPFLLYYPMILTHSPFQPTPDSVNWNPKAMGEEVNNDKKHFADMVAYMDKMIGKMVTRLDELKLRENTLIIFLGDNGTGVQITSQLGDRTIKGAKGSTIAAGLHVPLIASWPGTIPAGKVNGDLIDTTDFLPTMCGAAGVKLPADKLDGRSFLPQLRGEKGAPREWFYCWYARDGGAVASQEFAATKKYKLYRNGMYYDYQIDENEKKPLSRESLNSEAAAAHRQMQAVLDEYKNARPEAYKTPAKKKKKG